MKFTADLHIHSKYSRACSPDLDLEHNYVWAQLKGINIVGTGDFTHPQWMKDIKEKLEPAEEGLFKLKDSYAAKMDKLVPEACRSDVRFMLTVEISNIYKRLDKVRKVHNCIFVPSFKAAEKIQTQLGKIGNISSDGRPILGLSSHDLLDITLQSDPQAIFVPAHIWTPWFSVLGSKGGYDRMEDAFGELTKHIFAVETGLSSDPLMNWRLNQLDDFVLVSNSDAHSSPKLGREATMFDTELSYPAMYRALSDPNDKGLTGTIEFFPEEGKYHYDGHRMCQTRMHPKETIKNKGLCPVCGKSVTVGVMARVEELADREEGQKSKRWRPYVNLIPLPEVIAQAKGTGPSSKQVEQTYQGMLAKLGCEFFILQDISIEEIKRVAGDKIADGIARVRTGKVNIAAGYDGKYGTIHLFDDKEPRKTSSEKQMLLF